MGNFVMLQLGPVQFSMDTRSYEELEHNVQFRWPMLDRLGRRPASQFLGIGEETISLKGCVYPSFDPGGRVVGAGQIQTLRSLGEGGSPHNLMTGSGRSLGKWIVLEAGEVQSSPNPDGVPRKQDFNMKLRYYGNEGLGMDGVLFGGGVFFVPRLSFSGSVSIGGFNFSAGISIGG